MLGPILTGLIAGGIAFLPRCLHSKFPNLAWSSPVLVLGVGAIAMLLQKYVIERRAGRSVYGGLPDLFLHIHSPPGAHSALQWVTRGIGSLLLACFGGCVGPEGAAVEFAQAASMRVRMHYSRWFEQKRRTDVASSLAGGISAAFGAPFAGVLFPAELGVGGRGISSATSSFSAFLFIQYLLNHFSVEKFDVSAVSTGYRMTLWRHWVGVMLIGAIAGAAAVIVIRFIRYTQESLKSLFQTRVWMRIMAGAILLSLVFVIVSPFRDSPFQLLEQVLWLKHPPNGALLLFSAELFALAVVLSSFGTIGIIWPLLALGGVLGFCVNHWILGDLADFATVASLASSAALCGAILGIPFTASVMIYEMTQNVQFMVPCLVAALIAQKLRELLRARTLIDQELRSRGLTLVEGRSLAVLKSIPVREAMVTDFEVIHDQESVSELRGKTLKSRYPFLPVVNTQGIFSGLLTIDMVQEACDEPLSHLLEVKDILYRTGFKSPSVKVGDRLSAVVGMFEELPCMPVTDDDGRVLGLIFVFSVRLAYEREVAKQSFSFVRDADSSIR